MQLKLLSYNLHKGKTLLGNPFNFFKLSRLLDETGYDIGLFQEVLGEGSKAKCQVKELIDEHRPYFVFQQNSTVAKREHGNLIVSRYPILETQYVDLTLHRLEKRNAIIAKIKVQNQTIYFICTHLNLRQRDRTRQIQILLYFIKNNLDQTIPIILGGDFNDWNGTTTKRLLQAETFKSLTEKKQTKTFPAPFPLLALDRVFVSNNDNISFETKTSMKFSLFSDHAPLFSKVRIGENE